MKKIVNFINKFATYFLMIFCTIIICSILVINSRYSYLDTPEFIKNNVYTYTGMLFGILWIVVCTFLGKYVQKKAEDESVREEFRKNKHISILFVIFAIFVLAQIIFIALVPLKPFSDMLFVVNIAKSKLKDSISYLQMFPNNLPITLIFLAIFSVFGQNVIVIKYMNLICTILTTIFMGKTYENIFGKKNYIIYFLGITYISSFIYVNHAYNDLIFTCLNMYAIYLVTKKQNKKIDYFLIPLTLYLQYILRPVGLVTIIGTLMYYVFNGVLNLNKQKDETFNLKEIIKTNIYVKKVLITLITLIVLNIAYKTVEIKILPKSEEYPRMPIASWIQMGIDPVKIGFQNRSHDKTWTLKKVGEKIKMLGADQVAKTLFKKTIWLWSEGTFQASKYSFMDGNDFYFSKKTIATINLTNPDENPIRLEIDGLMKGQYLALFIFALITIIYYSFKKNTKQINILGLNYLYYYILGFICFYIIWEMCARYIYSVYPFFIIFASSGINIVYSFIGRQIKKIKEK